MAIDIATNPTTGLPEVLVALTVVGVIWVIFLFAVRYIHLGGVTDSSRYAEVRKQLDLLQPTTLTIPQSAAGDVAAEYRDDISRLFESGQREHGDPTAITSVHESLRRLQPPERITRLALSVATEGTVILALALLLQYSARHWEALFTTSGTVTLAGAVERLTQELGTLVDILSWGGPLAAFATTVVIMLYDWLYANAGVVAGVLLVGALAIALVDHYTEADLDVVLFADRRRFYRDLIGSLALVWVVGLVTARVGAVVGIGGLLSLFVTLLVSLSLATFWLYRFHRRLDTTASQLAGDITAVRDAIDDQRAYRVAVGYLLARKLMAGLGAVALPLVPMLLVDALLNGALAAPFAAFAGGSPVIHAATVAAILVGVGLLARSRPDQARAIYWWVTSASRRRLARLRHAVGGGALAGLVFLMLILLSFGASLWVSIIILLAVFAAGRRLWRLYQHLSLRGYQSASNTSTASVVQVRGGIITVGGYDIFIGEAGGRRLAAPTRGPLVDQIITDVESLLESGEVEPTILATYHERLVSVGDIDPDAARKEERVRARTVLRRLAEGEARAEDVDNELFERFDPSAVDRVKAAAKDMGELVEGDNHYYWRGSS